MPNSQGLYYPGIDIRDEAWLKTSLLYWDSLRTIVPESIDVPYSSETALALQDAGFLIPLRVHSDMEEIRELTEDVLTYLNSNEGAELLISGNNRRRSYIHLDKLSTSLVRLLMHRLKFGHEALDFVSRLGSPSRRGVNWLELDEGFALFYMTLLASRLAERVGASLLTSLPNAENLAIKARFDTQINRFFPSGVHRLDRRYPLFREFEACGPRRPMPRTLAPGMLSELSIQQIVINPNTSIDDLLKFRERHRDELALFRTKIHQLTSAIEVDLPAESLRQHISDLYTNEVRPAIDNLKHSLEGQRIRWLAEGLFKIVFLSVGSSSLLISSGLDVPTALLAGAGLSLIISGTIYNVDKRESLLNNPYSYLLSIERELT